nr:26S proteasome SU [Cryptomonas curvata]
MTSIKYLLKIESFVTAKMVKYKMKINNLKKKKINLLAHRNLLNEFIKGVQYELSSLQKEGSYIGDVLQYTSNDKILIRINVDGKFIVHFSPKIKKNALKIGSRVALKSESYLIYRILPQKTDPLISLMRIENIPNCTYRSIGGLDFQIEQLKEVIELPIKFPEIFEKLGVSQPKGVLLYGPPGTGKTLLARAVAHHSDCTFIRISGSELVQKYIGEGSRMVRDVFLMAKNHAPSIIFMDEIDSIGSSRGVGGSITGDSEVQRTMLELLNQLDGFDGNKKIKVLMATNRIDVLDPALIRPGRIDRKIRVPNPNTEGRLSILKIHLKKIKIQSGIDLWEIAKKLQGSTGAEIKAVCMEAGIFAIRSSRVVLIREDFNLAIGKLKKRNLNISINIRSFFKK